MIDLKFLEQNTDEAIAKLSARGVEDCETRIDQLMKSVSNRRDIVSIRQGLEQRRNELSKEIGEKIKNGENVDSLKTESNFLSEGITKQERLLAIAEKEIENALLLLPNLPAHDVPKGKSETDNVVVRYWQCYDVIPTSPSHVEIGQLLGAMDFERATKVSGSRFVYLRGALARLERVLGDFMLDHHIAAGWNEISPPTLVNQEAMIGTGQLPKFAEDAYSTQDGLYLIPTSEVSLTNIVRDEIIPVEELPIKMVAQTLCYRREAGSAGRDTKGMIRQHQFRKVEMVAITRPEDSEAIHEQMLLRAEGVLKSLCLPYRVVLLCEGDMGFSAQKTYDLEVWLPSQGMYREISSISNCGDFQARRMKARFKRDPKAKTEFVHTLNGSGLAVGRTLIAVLENYGRADGSIIIPSVLRERMGGSLINSAGEIV